MPKFDTPAQLFEVLSAPMGDLIASVGRSVAVAQEAIDRQSIDNFKIIYDEGNAALEEFRSLGYRPSWYHYREVEAELMVALTVSGETESSEQSTFRSRVVRLYGAPVDASYGGKYNFDIKASSRIKFAVVPIPPPEGAAEMLFAPDLMDKNVGEAREVLSELGIQLAFAEGTTQITEGSEIEGQQPLPGHIFDGWIYFSSNAEITSSVVPPQNRGSAIFTSVCRLRVRDRI